MTFRITPRTFNFAACASILLSACQPAPVPEEVAGTYVLSDAGSLDTLILEREGRYRRTGREPGAKSGRWEYDAEGGTVRLHGFAPMLHGDPTESTVAAPVPMVWITQVDRTITGKYRLAVDYDSGTYYLKVSGQAD